MRVIKKINNNVAICVDGNNKELIAFGKGIGFPPTPYELTDLKKIDRTYYDINQSKLALLEEIPDTIFTVAAKIVKYAEAELECDLNTNLIFTLADHINFAILRHKEGVDVELPMNLDIQFHYQTEVEIGRQAVRYINEQEQVTLPGEEAVAIAMHFINAEKNTHKASNDNRRIIEDVTGIIETKFKITIDKEGFNYSRFVSHMQYLLKRQKDDQMIVSDNASLYETIKTEYPDIYLCATDINQYLSDNYGWNLTDEEEMYLMLHLNRLCSREACTKLL